MTEYKTKTFTVDAWPVGLITPENIPDELVPYVEGKRINFLSYLFEVVNIFGAYTPESDDLYLVLEDHNLYFIDPAELDVMFENTDGTPILPNATFHPRERLVDILAKAKLAKKEEEKEEKKLEKETKEEAKKEEPKPKPVAKKEEPKPVAKEVPKKPLSLLKKK